MSANVRTTGFKKNLSKVMANKRLQLKIYPNSTYSSFLTAIENELACLGVTEIYYTESKKKYDEIISSFLDDYDSETIFSDAFGELVYLSSILSEPACVLFLENAKNFKTE